MPRKITVEPVRRLTVELPESEYQQLEAYCLQRQETKRQVIRNLIQSNITPQIGDSDEPERNQYCQHQL